MEQNILEEIERLKHDYQDLKLEINELNNAVNKSQISISRKRGVYTSAGATCEAMLKFIYQKEGGQGKPANKLMLDELLLKVADFIPPQVMINFRTIQAWRNLGTHDKDDMRNIDTNSFIMVDMALSNVVNWFFSFYLKIEYSNEAFRLNGKTESLSTSKDTEQDNISGSSEISYPRINTKKVDKTSKQDKKSEPAVELSTSKSLINLSKLNVVNKAPLSFEFEELTIGNQIWMRDNLNVVEFTNGDVIRQARTKNEWLEAGESCEPAWCFYRSDAKGDKSMGLLYNWFAANDPRGLAPEGWRVPTSEDYEELIRICGGEKNVARKFAEFDGLKGVFRRKHTGTYTNASNYAWWTSSSGRTKGYCFEFVFPRFCESGFPKGTGFPIICIKETSA